MKLAIDTSRKNGEISRERQKSTDEVFTNEYCTKILLKLCGEESFKAGNTFFEPSAGDGNLVEAVIRKKLEIGVSPTQALKDMYCIEYMKDNYDFLCQRILNIVGDTKEHRDIISYNFAYANTLDPNDRSEGRKYPEWMDDYVAPVVHINTTNSLLDIFDF